MAAASTGDGLLRWLLGGLLAGGVVLGVIVGAYAVFDDGDGYAGAAARPTTTAAETGTNASSGGGEVARGKQLFAADGCGGCHSTDGSASVGPTIKGLAGIRVQLADGSTATADDAYLAKAIASPDAQIVKGYQQGVMSAATSSFGLAAKPQDVSALVAFIKSQR